MLTAVRSAVVAFLGLAVLGGAPVSAAAPAKNKPALECTLILEAASGAVLVRDGTCDRRVSPASTFKLPLALMGFDSDILVDGRTPHWDYRPEFNAVKRDHKPVDPTIWLKDSVVWFSQEITRKLGDERFASYVKSFGYGNGDISGNPGRADGLTHSWLSSSLKISPAEQVALIRGMLDRSLPVSAKAVDETQAAMPTFSVAGWRVRGKTGTGWLSGRGGAVDRDRPLGWFVGWAEQGGRRIAFARLVVNDGRSKTFMGPAVRDAFLADLPKLAE